MFLAGNCTPARQLAAGRSGFGQEIVFFYPRYLFENGRLCYNRRKFQLLSLVQSVMTARLEETCAPGRGSVKESADEKHPETAGRAVLPDAGTGPARLCRRGKGRSQHHPADHDEGTARKPQHQGVGHLHLCICLGAGLWTAEKQQRQRYDAGCDRKRIHQQLCGWDELSDQHV